MSRTKNNGAQIKTFDNYKGINYDLTSTKANPGEGIFSFKVKLGVWSGSGANSSYVVRNSRGHCVTLYSPVRLHPPSPLPSHPLASFIRIVCRARLFFLKKISPGSPHVVHRFWGIVGNIVTWIFFRISSALQIPNDPL